MLRPLGPSSALGSPSVVRPGFAPSLQADLRKPLLLRFGQTPVQGKTGVFFTVEYLLPGAANGGLGIVSDYIPRSLNQHHGKDVRVVMPATAALAQNILPESILNAKSTLNTVDLNTINGQNGWQNTHERISLPVPWRQMPAYQGASHVQFQVFQQYFSQRATWVYALVSLDPVLPRMGQNGYQSVSGLPKFYEAYGQSMDQGGAQLALLCNLALAQLAKRLDPSQYECQKTSKLSQFKQPVDFWISNDWMTANVLNTPEASPGIGQVFIVHNLYDKNLDPAQSRATANWGTAAPWFGRLWRRAVSFLSLGWLAKRFGWQFQDPPTRPLPPYDLQKTFYLNGSYSLLNTALKGADSVVVSQDFLSTMRDTDLLSLRGQHEVRQTLKNKPAEAFFDMHHGAAPEYSPVNNPVLNEQKPLNLQRLNAQGKPLQTLQVGLAGNSRYGFESLPNGVISQQQAQPSASQLSTIKHYKQANKQALQKLLGWPLNPQARIYCWTNRLDSYQKLAPFVLEAMYRLMQERPEAYFVIMQGYDDSDPGITRWLTRLQQDFSGRFTHLNYNTHGQILLNAGADYALLPSMYEPYGLAQLQGSQLGSVPIASDVDGLHATVSDPVRNTGRPVAVWQYGQTGLLLQGPTAAELQQMHRQAGNAHSIRQRLMQGLQEVLHRAEALAVEQPDTYLTTVYNGMRFIQAEHDWRQISGRYAPPIAYAMQVAQKRQANTLNVSA